MVSVTAVEDSLIVGGSTDVDGSASDADGDTLSYLWESEDINDPTNTDVGTFSNTITTRSRWTAPNTPGTYRIKLTATETAYGGTGEATVDITVNANTPPVINSVTGQIHGDSTSTPVEDAITINKDQDVLLIVDATDVNQSSDT